MTERKRARVEGLQSQSCHVRSVSDLIWFFFSMCARVAEYASVLRFSFKTTSDTSDTSCFCYQEVCCYVCQQRFLLLADVKWCSIEGFFLKCFLAAVSASTHGRPEREFDQTEQLIFVYFLFDCLFVWGKKGAQIKKKSVSHFCTGRKDMQMNP